MAEWHLRKEVTIGNIFTAFLALIAALSAWYNLDTRLTVVETQQTDIKVHLQAESVARKEDVERVCSRLDRIENIMIELLRDGKSAKNHKH